MPHTSTGAAGALDLEGLPPSTLLTRAELAPIIKLSILTLKRWAAEGKGPAIHSLGGRPRYRVRDVLAWIEGEVVE